MLKMLMFISIFFLTACVTPPPVVIYKNIVIAPDDALITKCPIAQPPNKDAYIASSMKVREEMLVSYIGVSMNNSFVCNEKFTALQKWKVDATKAANNITTSTSTK